MNAAVSSSYPDPFINILILHFPTDLRKILNDPELQSIIDTFDLPKLQASDVASISEKLSQGKSYNESIRDHSYQFPFRPSSLAQIVNKCPQDGTKRANFAVCFILHSYVSFCLLLEKNCSLNYLPALLQALYTIINITPLATEAFIRALSYYAKKRDFYQLKIYTPIICDFFRNANLKGVVAFDIFADLFDGLTKDQTTNVCEDAYEFFMLIASTAEEKSHVFPRSAAIKIMNSLKHLIIDMDFHTLDMASHVGSLLGQEYVSELCKLIIPVIISRIVKEPPTIEIIFNENSQNLSNSTKIEPPEQILKPFFQFRDEKTFSDGFNVVNRKRLPERDDIISLCKPEILANRIGLFLKIIQHYEESAATFLDTFQDSISVSVKNRHFFDMMAHFLEAGLELSHSVKLPNMVRFLFSDILFDPKMICSIKDTNSYKLNSLRGAAFELILNEGPIALDAVLIESMPHPQLFTEIIYRCLVYRPSVISILPQSTKLLNTIITSTLYYQNYCFKGYPNVDPVRLAVFLFFSSLFNDKEIETFIFNNEYFISAFLSFMFEEPVRPFITNQLRAFLTKDNQKVTPMIGDEIAKIMEIVRPEFPSLRSVSLADDILVTIIEALSHQYLLAEIFRPVIDSIVESLAQLANTKKCQDFFLNSLQFFAGIAHDFTLSVDQLFLIETAISAVFDNNPSQAVFGRLVQILAAECIITVGPTFLIRQPLALPVFFRVFQRTSRYKEVIKFVLDLCTNVASNSIACHSCGLDEYLLESIEEKWYDDNVDVELVELILSLFGKISFSISSPNVVSRFVSLLSPMSDRFLPICFEKILSSLNAIVSSTLKCPETSIPLPQAPIFMQEPINLNNNQGFTFVAWIMMESIAPQYKPYLFSFSDINGGDINFKISLSSNIVVAFQRTPKSESNARADKMIPLSQWAFVSITCISTPDKRNLLVSINCQDSRELQFPVIDFNGKLVNFSFFGVAPDSVQPEIPVLIGPFALFPILDKTQVSYLFGHGPRHLNRVSAQPHFTLVPSSNQIHSISTTTFLKVLIKNCKLTILLPLFSLIDYKTIKGENVNIITDSTIELISNALLMSNQTEIEFANLHGFEMLSALLMSTDFSRLNYSMYLRFFSLLQLLRTGDLQQQLIRCIVGNIDLWIVTNAENHLRILKHWSRVLFLTNSPTDSFSTFLNNTVLFYWDNIHNRNYLKGMPNSARPRPKDLNVFECRQFMTIILLTMSQKKFTVEDFYLLMALCKKCPDKGTVLSLVHLVLLMAKTTPSPLSNLCQNENFLPLIHQLFQRRWPEITRMTIEIICMLHVNQIIIEKPSFEEHIETIIHHLTPKDITEDIFVYLYKKLLPSIPQLLPLCFWFAFNISNSAITKLIDETTPSVAFATSSHWAKWPIIVASQVSDSISASILVFLAKCGHKEWINLFSTIIIVSKSLEKDYNLMLCIFLTYLSNCLLCQTIEHTPENLTSFFEIVRHFLFFRDTKEKQREMEAAFKYSPFHDVPRGTPDSPRKENNRTRSMLPTDLLTVLPLIDNENQRKFIKAITFTKQICVFKNLPEKYDFGVRLDDRLRWSDFTLAQNTIHLIGMANVSEALDIDMVICTFILKSHPAIVQAHLRNLKLSPDLIQQNQMYIDLLCFKAMRLGIVCPFYTYRSHHFDTNSSKALFGTAKWDLEKFVSIPKGVLRSIKKFYKNFSQIEQLIDSEIDDDINDCFLKVVKRSLSDKKTETIENSKLYRQLWYSITQPGALWQHASIENPPESRDMIGCFCYAPFRTKNRGIKISKDTQSSIRPNFIANCEIIKNMKSIDCECEMFENRIELISCENQRRVVYYKDIKELFRRTRFHQKNSIEIFLFDNKSYFIRFFENSSKSVVNFITKYEPRLFKPLKDIIEISNLWINRKITNFEYLMALNKESGRTFNDLTQYPIFPWIIKDYVSESIKLKDTSLYRELLKPIGTLNDERIKKLRTFSEDQKTGSNFGYLYKSAPSSYSSTLSFLGNLPPYSEILSESEKFRSILDTFKTVISQKEDFRELIPEFFFCPEIFKDVALPPWAKSPIEFVYLNRKALESDNTSNTLNNWIDLMWGVDSRGRNAVKRENTFKHELYDTVWKTKCDLSFEEIIKLLQEKGIMPRQLFTTKHPQRIPLSSDSKKQEAPMALNATSNSIAFANIECKPNEDRIVLLYIDAAGILKRDTITFNRISDKIVNILNVDTSMLNIDGFNFVSDSTRFIYLSNNYLLASESSTLLLDIKNLSSTTFLSDPSQCLASSYPYFVTINGEFILNVFHISDLNRPEIIIPYVRTYAICVTMSNDFHMIVVGAENEMMIYSLIPNALSRRIALDNLMPLMMTITPSWGFIIVFAVSTIQNNTNVNNNSFNNSESFESIDNFSAGEEKFLLTFSVNGELIRKVPIQYDVVAMTSWKSDEGFDFIAFANTKRKIYVCEAFYLDVNTTPIMKCQSDVREISYAQQIQMLIVVAKDGTFMFQPYVAKRVE